MGSTATPFVSKPLGSLMKLLHGRTLIAAAVAGILSATAHAQQAPTSAPDASNKPEKMEEVVVTGSMLKGVDAQTAEAVTTVKIDALKDLGVSSVEQALALLTSNNATITTASNVATFNGGASVAALRGMRPTETLVLLDGQRLANNVTLGSGVDLNTIPFAAIDHIEVLREGASSLYGSDA